MGIRRRRARKIFRIVKNVLLVVVGIAVIVGVAFAALSISGKIKRDARRESWSQNMANGPQNRYQSTENGEDQRETEPETEEEWEVGDVRYQGKTYRYNSQIMTYLFMGIDKNGEVTSADDGIDGGQSDAMFLLVLNPVSAEISIIGINRNTMTEIDAYDRDNQYIGTVTAQLTLQHGYGDGEEQSCELSCKAVSRLFYGMPIDGYCAINLDAVPIVNDAVGGVDVVVLEEIKGKDWQAGETVHLMGKDALKYVQFRDTTVFGSANRRLERQKQYITAFAEAVLAEIKKDFTFPVTLYNMISKYMVTDVALDEVVYLATQITKYSSADVFIYSLEGETIQGEKFEEFYVDETALYELILNVFYTEVTKTESGNEN